MRHQLSIPQRISAYCRRAYSDERNQEITGAISLTVIFGYIGWYMIEALCK